MRYRGNMDDNLKPLSATEVAAAVELLHEAAFAYLAMVEAEGPYVLPLNFAYIGGDDDGTAGPAVPPTGAAPRTGALAGRIYFHTGEGRKTAALAADPRVCLAVTANVAFHQGGSPCGDGFTFRSLLLWGEARRIDDPARRESALRAIVAKYDPGAAALPFGETVYARTALFEMTIEAAGYKERPSRNGPRDLRGYFRKYLAPTWRRAGRAPSTTWDATQYAMRKYPGLPKPLPGTTSTRCSCISRQKATSSSMGVFGNI